MTFLQWRRFNFFDKEIARDPTSNEPFDKLKGVRVTACASGRGQLIVGDDGGSLYFVSRQLDVSSFHAYELCVTHLYQLKQHNILVTVGEDEPGLNPLIKVWNLDKVEKGSPLCSRIARAIPGNTPTKVTCLAVHENLNHMAVGFQNGSIVLFKGDVIKERHSKQRVIHEGSHPITGLAFKSQSHSSVLFVVTEHAVMSFTIHTKSKDVTMRVLDNHGCVMRCCTDSTLESQFVIGRRDAVYFYQADERGPCLAFEGEKLLLHWYRGYLIVVGRENKLIPRAGAGGSGQATTQMYTVTLYDIKNKFVAFSAAVPEVVDVICEWGSPYVLLVDGKLYQLREKDTQTKLETLFKKNLYVVAISLAQSQHYDQDGVVDIYRQYGDHLYSKGDHNGAIQQYIDTIGTLEASYVIRKFLDASRIHNLTAYLEALHKAQLATEDHTTLLLNCCTKLKDVKKLDDFIMTKDREVDFDVETAIRVCRSAGYYRHAVFLAEKHHQHDWYLKIQLDDVKSYSKALDYISKLDFEEAEMYMKKYGKMLMNEDSEKTTELLKCLCTDYRPSDRPLVDIANLEGGAVATPPRANAEEFIHIFVNNQRKLTEFLEHMIMVQPSSPPLLYNTLTDLYLHEYVHEKEISAKVDKERKTLDLLQNPNAGYDLDQVLVLCQMYNFKAGILFLYEKAKLYQQILRYHVEHNEHSHIIETCKKFGQFDSNLWIQALAYFARKEEDCKQQIVEVLAHIDKNNLLPPLLVVQTLAHNSTATLAVVKDYITRRLEQQTSLIEEDERLIQQYREDTAKMRNHIEELKTSAKIFQASKCSVCSRPLDVPSIHFLCQHSYHQQCFESYAEENDSDCPACLPENRRVLDIIHAQEHSRDLHEQFHSQLERAQDGFSVIAEYFSRGVFNKVTVLTDPPSPRIVTDPAVQRQQLFSGPLHP